MKNYMVLVFGVVPAVAKNEKEAKKKVKAMPIPNILKILGVEDAIEVTKFEYKVLVTRRPKGGK